MKRIFSLLLVLASFAFSFMNPDEVGIFIKQKIEQENVTADGIFLLSTEILAAFYRKTNYIANQIDSDANTNWSPGGLGKYRKAVSHTWFVHVDTRGSGT
ncbi:MAG TPA: hypothetical protein EYP36_09005 [Calditrichaeota bacterium]|nr:hypothetical protein [Calditrichota bacterium]